MELRKKPRLFSYWLMVACSLPIFSRMLFFSRRRRLPASSLWARAPRCCGTGPGGLRRLRASWRRTGVDGFLVGGPRSFLLEGHVLDGLPFGAEAQDFRSSFVLPVGVKASILAIRSFFFCRFANCSASRCRNGRAWLRRTCHRLPGTSSRACSLPAFDRSSRFPFLLQGDHLLGGLFPGLVRGGGDGFGLFDEFLLLLAPGLVRLFQFAEELALLV